MEIDMSTRRKFIGLGALALGAFAAGAAAAQQATTVQLTLKDHRFSPAEVRAPANAPVTIVLRNLDPTPAEFESKTLRVEKVAAGGATVTINIRALAPGRYRFFDDYNEATTFGFLVVE
jgi:hypothetical protein